MHTLNIKNDLMCSFKHGSALIYIALHGNTPIKNAWRMKNKSKDKWYIIYAKTLKIKSEWMDAFHRERARVLEDHEKGMLHNIM